MSVAFCSQAFTRNLYKGLVEIKVEKITDLPDDDNGAESLLTGGGVDAYLLVAAIEGQWTEDVRLIEKEAYNDGVVGLVGAAHVGRSRTAWANVNENKSKNAKRKDGQALAYHIKSSWGSGGQAIFDDEPSFYLYVQEPAKVRLVFTVMDDDIVGDGDPVGSAHRKLTELIPTAAFTGKTLIDKLKANVIEKYKRGEVQDLDELLPDDLGLNEMWDGEIKLTSKPRIKDKKGNMAIGVAAGAVIAGPVGAAAGAFLSQMYEGQVRGRIKLKVRYLPIPPVDVARREYVVRGGLPGIEWGQMYNMLIRRQVNGNSGTLEHLAVTDLEHCFFINHDETGACCAVYRSLEKKIIVISFRGTCAPKDLITDATILQDAWVEGEDVTNREIAKVHAGFRNSLNSISRRLKELVLATPARNDDISQYDMLVTGHSLGGALATLFTLDIAEYGIDAGRALPQLKESDDWWKSIATTLMGDNAKSSFKPPPPPRPKTLRMYNFGSPRVGNSALAAKFSQLQQDGFINEAYRIVNGDDLVARNPRTINALAFGNIGYEHCASTVLISSSDTNDNEEGNPVINPRIWIEGESDDQKCPVRDGTPLTSPLADGSLLSDISNAMKESFASKSEQEKKNVVEDYAANIRNLATRIGDRIQNVSATDLTSVLGINKNFTEREVRMIKSIMEGKALAHHMEDEYYSAMGRASGFLAKPGEELEHIVQESSPHDFSK